MVNVLIRTEEGMRQIGVIPALQRGCGRGSVIYYYYQTLVLLL